MALFALSQRVGQVVDHGAEVGAGGEPLLEPLEQRLAVGPPLPQPAQVGRARDDGAGRSGVARLEPGALLAEASRRLAAEPFRLRLLERFLHLQPMPAEPARGARRL